VEIIGRRAQRLVAVHVLVRTRDDRQPDGGVAVRVFQPNASFDGLLVRAAPHLIGEAFVETRYAIMDLWVAVFVLGARFHLELILAARENTLLQGMGRFWHTSLRPGEAGTTSPEGITRLERAVAPSRVRVPAVHAREQFIEATAIRGAERARGVRHADLAEIPRAAPSGRVLHE